MADAIFRAVASDPDITNADSDSGDKDRDLMIAHFRRCKGEGTIASDTSIAGFESSSSDE